MFGLLDWIKLGVGAIAGAALGYLAGHWAGESAGRSAAAVKAVQAANEAYRNRSEENAAVDDLDAIGLCIDLGGLPDACRAGLRGLAEDQTETGDGGLPGRQ